MRWKGKILMGTWKLKEREDKGTKKILALKGEGKRNCKNSKFNKGVKLEKLDWECSIWERREKHIYRSAQGWRTSWERETFTNVGRVGSNIHADSRCGCVR